MTPSETSLLLQAARGKRVIECGALIGGSTLPLASVASQLISIDRHEGYGPPTLRAFMSRIESKRNTILPLCGDVRLFLPHLGGDLTLIDLTGAFDLTKWCLDHARTPLVAIHDTHRPFCDGVAEAIIASLDVWEPCGQADTLTLLRRRQA